MAARAFCSRRLFFTHANRVYTSQYCVTLRFCSGHVRLCTLPSKILAFLVLLVFTRLTCFAVAGAIKKSGAISSAFLFLLNYAPCASPVIWKVMSLNSTVSPRFANRQRYILLLSIPTYEISVNVVVLLVAPCFMVAVTT